MLLELLSKVACYLLKLNVWNNMFSLASTLPVQNINAQICHDITVCPKEFRKLKVKDKGLKL
jgi:hypothetical protein